MLDPETGQETNDVCPVCGTGCKGHWYEHWAACGLLLDYNSGECICGYDAVDAFGMAAHWRDVPHDWQDLITTAALKEMP